MSALYYTNTLSLIFIVFDSSLKQQSAGTYTFAHSDTSYLLVIVEQFFVSYIGSNVLVLKLRFKCCGV